MIYEDLDLNNYLFKDLHYENYLEQNNIHKLVGINLEEYGDVKQKIIRSTNYSVNPNGTEAFTPELDDLCRLHFLITSRKATTILEFGIGQSTIIFNDALEKNKSNYEEYVKNNLRRNNPFECHSLDNNQKWIDEVKNKNDLKLVKYHYSDVVIDTFNDRICTFYNNLPNVCPDFIYLDGPDQFSPKGNVRGVSTNHKDRLPMVGDILAIEHFLLPGTLLVTDGRTANARFIKSNLQRDWVYFHEEEYDQHYFELRETPLGIFNKKQIDYCLGDKYFNNLNRKS